MGVKIKKRGAKWYVYVDYHGKRKNRSVGTREAAERVRREIEARLALGDVSFLTQHDSAVPVFGAFADGLRAMPAWSARHRRQMATKEFSGNTYDLGLPQSR